MDGGGSAFARAIAHGLPTALRPPAGSLFGPLRNARPMGWIGGSRRREAERGDRRQPALGVGDVPWRPGTVPCERGNISYHDA